MEETFKEADYYSLHKILTYNAVWNLVIGARGLGKSFDAKRHVIRDAIKNGAEFIYLRRTDVELKKGAKEKFMADILPFFKGFDFRINGQTLEWRKTSAKKDDDTPEEEWHVGGYFIALSQAGGVKSIAYPKVRWIVFDEVFPDNLQFLSGEVTLFESLYDTVDRRTGRCRVILLSNAVSMANPYFSKFGIDITDQLNRKTQFKRYCDGFWCIEMADYAGFSAKSMNSRYGRFLQKYDKEYSDYSTKNRFLDDMASLIEPLDTSEGYGFTLDTEESGTFGIWVRIDGKVNYHISRRTRKHPQYHYTLDYHRVSDTIVYVKRADDPIQNLLAAYRTGRVRFDSRACKADFIQVIGGLLGK